MKRLLMGALSVCLLATAAQADFINLPVKWSQPPDLEANGNWSDHTSVQAQVFADDFVFDSPEPIVAVRWWGLYWGEYDPRPNGWADFDISFHLSEWAHPRSQAVQGPIALHEMVLTQEVFTGAFNNNGNPVYRYDAYLPTPFEQSLFAPLSPNLGELFIDICKPSGEQWAWQHADGRYGPDFASYAWDGGHQGRFTSSDYSGHPGKDMAFELMIPEPASLLLVGSALVGTLVLARKKR